jgi:hypothetical protein
LMGFLEGNAGDAVASGMATAALAPGSRAVNEGPSGTQRVRSRGPRHRFRSAHPPPPVLATSRIHIHRQKSGAVPRRGFRLAVRAAEAASPQDAPPRFAPTDVFVGIICGWTRHRRSLEANGFG